MPAVLFSYCNNARLDVVQAARSPAASFEDSAGSTRVVKR